jgi:hypothetical protein
LCSSVHLALISKSIFFSFIDFIVNAPYAFTNKQKTGFIYNEYEIAEPLAVSSIPDPPTMTRELLYRAVFNEVDAVNASGSIDGYITLNKLVKTMGKVRKEEMYMH